MDLATGWSLIRLAQSGASVLAGANPIGFAVTATFHVKRWVDSESAELLKNVRNREGCPHIEMIEGAPPGACAVLWVAENGGMAWLVDRSSLWFCHPDATFRPLVFQKAMIKGPQGVRSVQPDEYTTQVPRPRDGYGCSKCREAQKRR